jgi:hypothetical protein
MYDLASENDQIYFVGDANDWDTTPPPGQSLWLVSTDSNGVISGIQDQVQHNQEVLVYPNPSSGYFTIELQSDFKDQSELEILDFQGRVVRRSILNTKTTQIDASQWPGGLYFYRISYKEGELRGKVIVE